MRQKILTGLMVCLLLLPGVLKPVTAAGNLPVSKQYYVAKDGSDENPGTITQPFATLEKARDTVRNEKGSLPDGEIIINIRGGTYQMSSTFGLSSNDAGTERKPITYRAYPGEKVVFSGGQTLDLTRAQPVTAPGIRERIIDPDAREKVVQLNLREQGINSIDSIPTHGFGRNGGYEPQQIYLNKTALEDARWPNDDWLYIAGVNGLTVSYTEDRPSLWKKAKDPYGCGYWGSYFADHDVAIKEFDFENKTFTLKEHLNGYDPVKGFWYFFYNLLEEIDLPGESYIDRDSLTLYFYPTVDLEDSHMEIALFNSNMFELNGASYTTIQGLNFELGRKEAVTIRNCVKTVVDGCELARMHRGVSINGGSECGIINSHIYDMGGGGVNVQGGDRRTLTKSGHYIRDNHIHDVNRVLRSYYPTVTIGGVGITVEHNDLNNSPHMLMQLNGNEHTIQYNEIYNAVTEATDMGAVYWGRNPTWLGIKINYNYFHDIGNQMEGYGSEAVFIDDGCCSTEVQGNVFYRAGGQFPVKVHGGQYNQVFNNIFIDNKYALESLQWECRQGQPAEKWQLWLQDKYIWSHGIMSKLNAVNYQNPPYSVAYPWLPTVLTDPAPVDSNVLERNLIVNGQGAHGPATQRNNYITNSDPGFADFANGDFTLRYDSPAFSQIEGFQPVPFRQMGTTWAVSGQKPEAKFPMIKGSAVANTEIAARFAFYDADGDRQAAPDIQWYIGDSADGSFTKLENKKDRTLKLDISMIGKYVKYSVIPRDSRMIDGEAVESKPVRVMNSSDLDTSTLVDSIADAARLWSETKVGRREGQTNQTARDAFYQRIEAAYNSLQDPALTQTKVSNALLNLQTARGTFEASLNRGGLAITGVTGDSGAVTAVSFSNTTGKAQNGTLIITRILGNNTDEVIHQEITIPADQTYTAALEQPAQTEAGGQLKIMLWDSISGMQDMTDAFIVE